MTHTAIAKRIGVHKSTISRKISRNTGKRSYRYKQACLLVKEKPRRWYPTPSFND